MNFVKDGRRVYPTADGFLPPLEPGDYGHAPEHPTFKKYGEQARYFTYWHVASPVRGECTLPPSIFQLEEHTDGTLTVNPSIQFPGAGGWHGFLKAGKWYE